MKPKKNTDGFLSDLISRYRAALNELIQPKYQIATVELEHIQQQLAYFELYGLPPFYVPGAVRVASTVTDVSSARRSVAESGQGHILPTSVGVRYPSEL